MRGAAALAAALVVIAASLPSACSTFGVEEAPDGGAADAACAPPACGGAGGRCGKVDACGLTFSCGECAPPYACVGGTCQCVGPDVCKEQSATCGSIDDGCNQSRSCGTCGAGMTCRSTDGGLACASGTCTAATQATTCKGKCNKATNNCGEVVTCGDCEPSALCGADGKANTCSCPPRTLPLNQFYDARYAHFCYSQDLSCPGTNSGAIGRLYSVASPGLLTLYRCKHIISATSSAFLLTTSTACEGLAGYFVEGSIGACAPRAVCGSLPLHRYYRPGNGGDWIHSFSATSPVAGYSPLGVACHAWVN